MITVHNAEALGSIEAKLGIGEYKYLFLGGKNMSGVLEQKEIGKKIVSIKEKMVCSRGFSCISNGFENLFRANNFTGGDCPECKEMEDCQFKSDLGLLYLCRCPLRMYVFSLIKMDNDAGMAALPSKRIYAITTQGTQLDR